MAVPKRRTSRTKRDKRRTHWKLKAPSLTRCSHCAQAKPPHGVCPHCGYYAGRLVVEREEE